MFIARNTLTIPHRQSLVNLEAIRRRRQRAADEISTGLRIRRPSDGPSEASGVVRTHSDLRTLQQFRTTLQTVSDQARAADTALNQAVDLVIRANTLASQGANFSQTAGTRAGMAVEVSGLLEQMITIANTNIGGKFLFAGLREETQPFLPDSISSTSVQYLGDDGRRSVGFPGGTEAPVSIDGRSVFLAPDNFLGSGRTAGSLGGATPVPPVGVGIRFSDGITGSIFADIPSFFVAAQPPTVPAAGNQVTVTFTSTDAAISGSVTATMAGGENTAAIAAALNAQLALSPALAGRVSFLDQAGVLKIVESDTVGVGFNFTASTTGGFLTGLETGGAVGGLSAPEIAAALNAQVALHPAASAAGVVFTAVGSEIQVDGNVNFTFNAVDFPRETGFVSGLTGQHSVGGGGSANVFRALSDLRAALLANDADAVRATLDSLGRAVQHLGSAQGFYGATQRQTITAIDSINQFELLNQEKLSTFQDADIVRSATELTQIQINEQAALEVTARQPGRNLFDFLA